MPPDLSVPRGPGGFQCCVSARSWSLDSAPQSFARNPSDRQGGSPSWIVVSVMGFVPCRSQHVTARATRIAVNSSQQIRGNAISAPVDRAV